MALDNSSTGTEAAHEHLLGSSIATAEHILFSKDLGFSDDQLSRFEVLMAELKRLPADADQVQWFMAKYGLIKTWLQRGRTDMVVQRMNRLMA
eukprot:gene2104-2423_t